MMPGRRVTGRRRRWAIGAIVLVAFFVLAVFLLNDTGPVSARPLDRQEQAVVEQARDAGLSKASATVRSDGGLLIEGSLNGRQIALAIPDQWTGDAMLFAHGYSLPGMAVAVSRDPVAEDPSGGILEAAYADGAAIGHSAYDKAGMGVESGAKATRALRDLVKQLGAKRVFVSGKSMGGNIVMALIERQPRAFDGAISACGVTAGWESEMQALIDMRAVYHAMTADTDYALPGDQDLSRSALSPIPPRGASAVGTPWRLMQMKRIAAPIEQLFRDAAADQRGQAARIVAITASLTPFEADAASFLFPLATIALGQDDLKATFGGNVYGNVGKKYESPLLDEAENRALNARIARISADPAAVRYARQWHRAAGQFSIPLVAVHNRIDPLVPYRQAVALRERVKDAGNVANLTQFVAPPVTEAVPGTGISGYAHCGFSKQQMSSLWETLKEKTDISATQDGLKPDLK